MKSGKGKNRCTQTEPNAFLRHGGARVIVACVPLPVKRTTAILAKVVVTSRQYVFHNISAPPPYLDVDAARVL